MLPAALAVAPAALAVAGHLLAVADGLWAAAKAVAATAETALPPAHSPPAAGSATLPSAGATNRWRVSTFIAAKLDAPTYAAHRYFYLV